MVPPSPRRPTTKDFPVDAIQISIKYEYFKRNSAGHAHKSVCKVLDRLKKFPSSNDSKRKEVPVLERGGSVDSGRAPNEPLNHFLWQEEEVNDEDFINLQQYKNNVNVQRYEGGAGLPEEPEIIKDEEDKVQEFFIDEVDYTLYQLKDVKQIFNKRMKREFETMQKQKEKERKEKKQKKKKQIIYNSDDVRTVLEIRQKHLFQKKKVLSMSLSVKKIEVVQNYYGIDIKMYNSSEKPEHTIIRYWRHAYGCLVWYKDSTVTFIENQPYELAAAKDLFLVLSIPKLILNRLMFDMEPYRIGTPKYTPNFRFFNELNSELLTLENKRIFAKYLYIKLWDDQEPRTPLHIVLSYLKSEFLKVIELAKWNNGNTENDEFWMFKKDDWAFKVLSADNLPKAWRKAEKLVMPKCNFVERWDFLTSFNHIRIGKLLEKQTSILCRAFASKPPEESCIIHIVEKMNKRGFDDFLAKISTDSEVEIRGEECVYKCPKENKKIVVKFKWNRIKIVTQTI